ncbi:MarR family winged helix-turn-helix transcriptional regulator [Falsiphaeobacter marinintestinus]|uniref:MarR family winged helix-turn-helix transcriptional regulator n=1 Tax=Falsiphaeobacter marinintestinus TaxID=1492905 RepID=UPI001C950A65|nr:MarR family transcriptional regulator [Phaeobacter marinintestinus]
MDIHTMPGHLIRRLNQISVALFMDQMEQAGVSLTPVQFAALSAIQEKPGIDQATVAGMIAYDRATLGKVIDRLDARGLVARSKSRKDRRSKELTLTSEGAALLKEALPFVKKVQPAILAGLSDAERDVIVDLLQKTTKAGNDHSRAPLTTPDQ